MTDLTLKLPKRIEPKSSCLLRAAQALEYTEETTKSFVDAFNAIRKERKAHGIATHEEMDLLRAMLVFACAGLDSITKQVIKDCYALISEKSPIATSTLHSHFSRKLSRDNEGAYDTKLLARILLSKSSPQKEIISFVIQDLTSGSLQSVDELLRVIGFLGIDPGKLSIDHSELKKIFEARNRIIHEMDIFFDSAGRKRRTHTRAETLRRTQCILSIAASILREVDAIIMES